MAVPNSNDWKQRVDLAASFLSHPTAKRCDWEVQKRFLLAKGFSEDEVQDAHLRYLTGKAPPWPLKPLDVGLHVALPAGVKEVAASPTQSSEDEESSGDEPDSASEGAESSSSSDDVILANLLPTASKEPQVEVPQAAAVPAAKVPQEEVSSSPSSPSSTSSSSSSSSGGASVKATEKPMKSVSGRVPPAKPAAAAAPAPPAQPAGSKAQPAATAAPVPESGRGFNYRSDADLWPPGSQVRPMLPAQRRELRRATAEVRACYQECQEDMKDLEAKASVYRRACAGKTELNEALHTLEVEAQRLTLQWSNVVAQVTSTWKDTLPVAAPLCSGVRPQVVRGKRWYVACLEVSGRRTLGPLRPSIQEAAKDQKLMMSSQKPPEEVEVQMADNDQKEESGGSPEADTLEGGLRRFKRLRPAAPCGLTE